MRPKYVLMFLLLAGLVLGGGFLLKQRLGNTPATPSAPEPAPAALSAAPPPAPLPVAAPPVATNTVTPEQREAAIEAEADRLQQLSMKDDAASLSNILADLTNPEQDVRAAAIEAAKQFGSTNAIPALQAAADNTEDPQEKRDLLEAAEFISLPSANFMGSGTSTPLTPAQQQALANSKAKAQARRDAQLQKRAGNQNPAAAPAAPGQNSTAPANP